MIKSEDVLKIGSFTKTHGIKGEVTLVLQNDLFDSVDPEYIICKMDGIFVPFFIESYRFKSNEAMFIKLEDIDEDTAAEKFVKLDAYLEQKQIGDVSTEEVGNYSWDAFKDFVLVDQHDVLVGRILDVDESTMNTLFAVEYNGEEILIPVQEELIEWIDDEKSQIKMVIPEGLLSL